MIINDDDDATSDLLGNFSKIKTKLETSNFSLWDDGEIRKGPNLTRANRLSKFVIRLNFNGYQ
jgi:hypothetical protein